MAKDVYYPIIYVRGYAGKQSAVENTVATPYMGFNLGSTKMRQAYDKTDIEPWIFESPLLRLMKDHEYVDTYYRGDVLKGNVPKRSIWIFRYYDDASKDLGTGKRKEIENYAEELRDFIVDVLAATKAKKVYLVAHSMGGLICRCYLQNRYMSDLKKKWKEGERPKARNNRDTGVDKLFTYATPHGGIAFRKGLGWVEDVRDFLKINNSDNFGHTRMRKFLDIAGGEVRTMNKRFPEERVFTLVGTDAHDYGAAAGLSKTSVGPMSDGLVQIQNAYLLKSPRAFVHRSHSGHYGIVNSEEGYHSLQRFLFGNLRADLRMENVSVTLPQNLARKQNVNTTYYIENVVSIRGVPVEIHRRTIDNEAAIHRNDDVIKGGPTRLYMGFLDGQHAMDMNKKTGVHTMGFLVRVRVVPHYHIDKKLRRDDHFEGKPIYEDGLEFIIERRKNTPTKVMFSYTSQGSDNAQELQLTEKGSGANKEMWATIPFQGPHIKGDFVIHVTPWNNW